jgi:hypothetical protein
MHQIHHHIAEKLSIYVKQKSITQVGCCLALSSLFLRACLDGVFVFVIAIFVLHQKCIYTFTDIFNHKK